MRPPSPARSDRCQGSAGGLVLCGARTMFGRRAIHGFSSTFSVVQGLQLFGGPLTGGDGSGYHVSAILM